MEISMTNFSMVLKKEIQKYLVLAAQQAMN